jgi:hypothetical protein
VISWHTTDHLVLDADGVLWRWPDPGLKRLGQVEDVAGDLAGEQAQARGHFRTDGSR